MKNSTKVFVLTIFTLLASFIFINTAYANTEYSDAGCIHMRVIKASHILVDTKPEADLIKSKIDSGASFEAMAAKYSKCPSGRNGGDLGYIKPGQMVGEFEIAAFKLPLLEVSEPVRTQFGWHLIKVYDDK